MLQGIGLLQGIMAKMNWLDQNQRVIAENVANADTPDFLPSILKEPDFKAMMEPRRSAASARLAATDDAHFGASKGGGGLPATGMGKQKSFYEVSPNGNGVVLEEQLFRAAENRTNFEIATNLYRRNVGMLRMVVQGVRG